MRNLVSCSVAVAATTLMAGAVMAGPDAYVSPDGQMTFARGGQAADVGQALLDPAGCDVYDETYNDSFPPNCCTGWTISDGYVGCYNRAMELVVETDLTGCELLLHLGHVTGPNQYVVGLNEDAGGSPGGQIASATFTDVAGPFGSENEPLVWDLEGLCLEAGTYWITINADGGGGTWGALNLNTMGAARQCWFDDDCSETYYRDAGVSDPGCLRLTATEGCGGGGLTLEVTGDCPGDLTATACGANEGDRVYFIYGFAEGTTAVPGCPGLEADIRGPKIAGMVRANAEGCSRTSGRVPQGACGRTLVQAINVDKCEKSNVVSI